MRTGCRSKIIAVASAAALVLSPGAGLTSAWALGGQARVAVRPQLASRSLRPVISLRPAATLQAGRAPLAAAARSSLVAPAPAILFSARSAADLTTRGGGTSSPMARSAAKSDAPRLASLAPAGADTPIQALRSVSAAAIVPGAQAGAPLQIGEGMSRFYDRIKTATPSGVLASISNHVRFLRPGSRRQPAVGPAVPARGATQELLLAQPRRSPGSLARAGLLRAGAAALAGIFALPSLGFAQYFGQNRTQYNKRDTHVMITEHYDIHFDKEAEAATRIVAKAAEAWYDVLSKALDHEFTHKSGPKKGTIKRKPVIVERSDALFWESNAVPGVGEGVGGVTEPYQNRMMFPMSPWVRQLIHVIGHEGAHQFQYDIAGDPEKLERMPLWLVEGMAEYLTTGKIDVNTAMWQREMALNGKLPNIQNIPPSYIAYRMGQSVLQYVAEKYGPEKIPEIFKRALGAENGVVGLLKKRAELEVDLDSAFQLSIGRTLDQLSQEWRRDVMRIELPKVAKHLWPAEFASPLAGPDHDKIDANFAPAVSPDGKRLAFFSFGRDMTLGVYAGDIDKLANEGKTKPFKPARLLEAERNVKLDSLRLLNAAQSWSPDGKTLAIATMSKGKAAISFLELEEKSVASAVPADPDAKSPQPGANSPQTAPQNETRTEKVLAKKSLRHVQLSLDDAVNPSWSPDGKQIVFSGMKNGFTNLYLVNADGTQLRALTEDIYSDLQAAWSPDGKKIAFATDRGPDTNYETLKVGDSRIAVLDLASGQVEFLPEQAGKNINPQWSPDGKDIAFISDRDGISNIFIYNFEKGQLSQATNVLSGITGLTDTSPAFVWAKAPGEGDFLIFTAMEQLGGTALYKYDEPREKAVPYVAPAPEPARPIGPRQSPQVDSPRVRPYEGVIIWKPGMVDNEETPAPVSAPPVILGPNGQPARSETPIILGPDGQPARTPEGSAPIGAETTPAEGGFLVKPYKPRLKIEISQNSYGSYGANSGFYQSAVLTAADIMGNHRLFLMLLGQAQKIQESNFLAGYINQTHPIDWGISAFQMGRPNNFTSFEGPQGPSYGALTYRGAEFFAQKPISRFLRWEASIQGVQVSQQQISGDEYGNVYLQGTQRRHYALPKAAFVRDTTLNGPWGPVDGMRARVEVGRTLGDLSFNQTYGDIRWYKGNPEWQIAARAVAGTMSGRDPQDFFLGGAHTVRGFPYASIIGEKMAMFNAEARFPLIPIMLVALPFPHLSQVRGAVFVDAARTWTGRERGDFLNQSGYYANKPVGSYGVAFQTLLLGLPFEIARVWKFDKNDPYAKLAPERYGKVWVFSVKVPW